MSQVNVDLVVTGLERWSAGDDTGALDSLAPDVELHHNIGVGTPLEGIYRGHAEVRKLWADIRESFGEARFDVERATEHDGRVLVLGTLRLRGRGQRRCGRYPLWACDRGRARDRNPTVPVEWRPSHGQSPRSGGAVGVGDVAGERGAGAWHLRRGRPA